jgi:tetratricopeptide (TPR) repeat protein
MIDPDPGLLERLFGTASIDPNVIALFRKMGEAQRQGRFADALALSDQIPKPIAESRQMLTARASLAMQAEKMDDYERTLALLASKYSNDPEVAFALVDRYFFKHQTEKLVQTMATIENRVGADGITSLIKVSAYLDAQDFDKAIASGKEAIRLEPDYDRAYTTLALVYVQAKKYEDAVKVFTDVEKRFGVVFERKNLVENPALGEFIKSAAFKRWLPAGK